MAWEIFNWIKRIQRRLKRRIRRHKIKWWLRSHLK